MGEELFSVYAKTIVLDYVKEHLDKSDDILIDESDIYIVWMCKTLQNNKTMLSTKMPDGMYYEITYNGDRKEFYLDAYKKFENRCIKFE